MAKPERAPTETSTETFGTDLHTFIDQYERQFPEEVIHVEKPIKAEWEVTALAMELEKDHRFPILVGLRLAD